MITKQINSKCKIVFSFDDYHELNTKIADILEKYGFFATFFIDTMKAGAEDQIKELNERGHEIGGHTLTHPMDMKILNNVELKSELESSKKQIENWTGKRCISFAYPRGRYNENVIEFVKQAGFEDARTTDILSLDQVNAYQLPTTVHIFQRKEYEGTHWLNIARGSFENFLKFGGVFHLWGHAHELDRDKEWDNLEKFLEFIKEKIS